MMIPEIVVFASIAKQLLLNPNLIPNHGFFRHSEHFVHASQVLDEGRKVGLLVAYI